MWYPHLSPQRLWGGLAGIHDLDALCCFNGLTHCPWCGKEGQNKGTVVNHMWTVHYRLGLVCDKCNDCPSTSSDTLCCHGWQKCQQPGEKIPNESVSSEYLPAGDRKNQSVLAGDLNRGVQKEWFPLGCPVRDTPAHWHSPGGEPMEKASPANLHIPSPVFPHNSTRWLPTTPELHKMCLSFEVDNKRISKG